MVGFSSFVQLQSRLESGGQIFEKMEGDDASRQTRIFRSRVDAEGTIACSWPILPGIDTATHSRRVGIGHANGRFEALFLVIAPDSVLVERRRRLFPVIKSEVWRYSPITPVMPCLDKDS